MAQLLPLLLSLLGLILISSTEPLPLTFLPLEPRGCLKNSCYRAIRSAAKLPHKANPTFIPSGLVDCASFMVATVYTETADGSTATTEYPSVLPSYGLQCTKPSNPQRAYSSACRCLGFRPSQTTAGIIRVQVTVTSTRTIHITAAKATDQGK